MAILCPVCKYSNANGALICENCGSELSGSALASSNSTRKLDRNQMAQAMTGAVQNSAIQFTSGTLLRFEVAGSNTPILVAPRATIIMGRRDPQSGNLPDVDLTPFAGYRMGVSRSHAVMNIEDGNHLVLQDLGSSNGTYLNGVKLSPHSPYRVQHGDEIRLGQMSMRIFIGSMYSAAPQPGNGDSAEFS